MANVKSESRKQKEKEVEAMLKKSTMFKAEFEKKMPIKIDRFSKMVPKMPDELFDKLYAILTLESNIKE